MKVSILLGCTFCIVMCVGCRTKAQTKLSGNKQVTAKKAAPTSVIQQIVRDTRVIQSLPLSKQRELPALAFRDKERFAARLGILWQDFKNPDARAYAAFLIGDYRLVQSGTTLLVDITFEDTKRRTKDNSNDNWYWGRYPAAEAVAKLGVPLAPYVVAEIGGEEAVKTQKILLWTLSAIYNHDKEIVRFVLHRRLNDKAEPVSALQKSNLEAALKIYLAEEPRSLVQ